MIKLNSTVQAWGEPDFDNRVKEAVKSLDRELLPLQVALTQSSYVSDSEINVVVLNRSESTSAIRIKVGIFYAGIIAGSCCSDDPTPVCEQTEYCELELLIDKNTAETSITLLGN